MALSSPRKLSRSDMGVETLPCARRVLKLGGKDKFHIMRNPWSSNLYAAKPSQFYNPIWTEIPMDEYNPRLVEHALSGNIQAWRRKIKEEEKPQKIISMEPRPYKSFYEAPLEKKESEESSPSRPTILIDKWTELSEEFRKKKEKEEAKQKAKKEKPHYMWHARCKSKHLWPLLSYCFPCEKGLQYKLFTKTLQIKRQTDEGKYRSKDPWEKYKLRRGTSPVHSYYPMQTCDDDYWPLQSKFQAKEKLEIYDRCKDALALKKKQEEEYLEEHPPPEKEEKKWRPTNLTRIRPHHCKSIRNQGSNAINNVLPLKTTNPITLVTPFAVATQERASNIVVAPHCQGVPLDVHKQESYSLDHIHPQVDHKFRYYPPGDLAFMPIHHCSKFQGLHSPRWRNKELYKTKRPHCTRYGGIHDVIRKANGTTYFDNDLT